MYRLVLACVLLLAAVLPASAQYVTLQPMESPLGGSATSVLTLDGGSVLLSQNGNVFRSDDDGETWVRVMAPTRDYPFPYLAKGSSGTVVASARIDPSFVPFSFVASKDAGRTWAALSEAELRTSLALRHPSAGWFATQSSLQAPDNTYWGVLLWSTDGVSNWVLSSPSLSGTPGSTVVGRRAFIGPDGDVWGNTDSRYQMDSRYEEHRLSRWNASAGTWEPGITVPGSFAGSAAGPNGRGVVLSRRSSNIFVYVTGWSGGVRATVDGGTTWALADPAVVGAEEAAGAVVATPDGRFLVGMSGGVVSWDGQGTWRRDGLNGVPVASMAVSASGTVFVASPAKGLYRRPAGTTAWTQVLPSLVTSPVLALSDDGRFAATATGLWCYDGQTWHSVDGDTVGVRPGAAVGIAGTARGTAVVRLAGDSPGGPDRQRAVATAACAGTNGTGDGIAVLNDQTVLAVDQAVIALRASLWVARADALDRWRTPLRSHRRWSRLVPQSAVRGRWRVALLDGLSQPQPAWCFSFVRPGTDVGAVRHDARLRPVQLGAAPPDPSDPLPNRHPSRVLTGTLRPRRERGRRKDMAAA